jgi:putative DNA primase/helicase
MAAEEKTRSANGLGDDGSITQPSEGRRVHREPANSRPRGGSHEHTNDRDERSHKEPPVNAIEAWRVPKKDRSARGETAEPPARAAPPIAPAETAKRLADGESDPWTVPQSVRDRFVQDGHRFYFPDGKEAFKERGRRLTTTSENSQVVHSLIEIARSRGWAEVSVTGTERFRQEAWRQARMAGLAVRGYRPSEAEREQLIRALGRNLPQLTRREDPVWPDAAPFQQDAGSGAPHASASEATQQITGRLIEHGRDAYRHDPKEEPSYFVRLQTPEGQREIWGKDIERAITKSLTQPQIGDEVVLQRTGQDAVTVTRNERDANGGWNPHDAHVYRNRWAIEKREFFEDRARAAHVVRDPTIDSRNAVRERPALTGTYLALRAAKLAAQKFRDPQDRPRFVAQVRKALADSIERGEPLQPVRLRERVVRAPGRVPRDPDRELTR